MNDLNSISKIEEQPTTATATIDNITFHQLLYHHIHFDFIH